MTMRLRKVGLISVLGCALSLSACFPGGEHRDSGSVSLGQTPFLVPASSFQSIGQHPSLFLDRAEIDLILQRVKSDRTYRLAYEHGLLVEAEQAWGRIQTGSRALPREQSAEHRPLAHQIRQVALGYAFTGRSDWGRAAADALLEYASFYPDLPILRRGVSGRLTHQTLDEAMLLINLVWAYDLVHPRLNPRERTQVEERLFRNAVAVLQTNERGKSNWQTWHNAAIGAIGFALGDGSFVAEAIGGRSGFLYQLQHSMPLDGIWYEQAIAYSYFTIHPLTFLAEAAHRRGIDLYGASVDGKNLKLMLDGHIYHAFSNLIQAPFGNSQPHHRLHAPWIAWNYAFAARHYQDPNHRWLWSINDPINTRLRGDEWMPVLLCLPYLDAGAAPDSFSVGSGQSAPALRNVMGSSLLAETGVAILRGAPGQTTPEAALMWKPKGTVSGHQHGNTLGIFWQSAAHPWISSSGRWAGYGEDVHQNWTRQTLSDNTVVVDRKSQYPVEGGSAWAVDMGGRTSAGTLEGFTAGSQFNYVRASTGNAYPEAELRRRLFLADDYTLDVFQASSDRPRLFDWVIHVAGTMTDSSLPLQPQATPLATGAGYPFLKDLHQADSDQSWRSVWQEPRVAEKLVVTTLGASGTGYFTAIGPWDRRERGVLLVSREAPRASFVTLLHPTLEPSAAHTMTRIGSESRSLHPVAGAVRIERAEGGATDYIAWNEAPTVGELGGIRHRSRDIILRSPRPGHLSAATAIESNYIETDDISFRTLAPANWSLSEHGPDHFLLVYDHATEMEGRFYADDVFQPHAIDGSGDPATGLVDFQPVEGGISWTLQPFTQYLLVRPGTPVGALPPMAKRFSNR